MTEATKQVVVEDAVNPLTTSSSHDEINEMAKKDQNDWKLSQSFKNDPELMKFFISSVNLFNEKFRDNIDHLIRFHITIDGSTQSWYFVPSSAELYKYEEGRGYDYDEIGGARRFAEAARGHLIYDRTRQQWLVWSGIRWVPLKGTKPTELYDLVNQLTAVIRAEQTSRKVYTEGDMLDGKPANMFRLLGSQRGISNIISIAQGEEYLGKKIIRYNYVSNKEKDDDILNVKNGEINLRTGELKPHNPHHIFTKVVPVNYNKDSKYPNFKKLLSTTYNHDKQLISWVQMAFGLMLSSKNLDEHFFILYGKKGREGKTLVIDAVSGTLGYDEPDHSGLATSTNSSILMQGNFKKSGESATPALASLDGELFVTTSEPENGSTFSEGLVKSLTGGDAISVRNLNQSPFLMFPSFTLFINTNTLPASDGSSAVMRRIIIIPHDHQVVEGSLEDDSELRYKLEKEHEGILAWMIEGSVRANEKRKQAQNLKKELREKLKAGEIKEAPLVHEDPLKPFPPLVQQAMLEYKFGANAATRFIFDSLVGKREAWNYLSSTIFNCCDFFGNNDKSDQYFDHGRISGQAIEALGLPRIMCDKNSYVRTHELYQAFVTWAEQTGTSTRGLDEATFNRRLSGIFPKARTSAGTVWLGVGLLPYVGKNKKLYDSIRGKYAGSIGEIGSSIVYAVKHDKTIDCEDLLTKLVPSKHTTAGQKQKIEDFIQSDQAMAFAGKYHDDTVNLINPNATIN